jgi:hypothetical protein
MCLSLCKVPRIAGLAFLMKGSPVIYFDEFGLGETKALPSRHNSTTSDYYRHVKYRYTVYSRI